MFADKLLQSGFRLATRAGISIAIDDMLVPQGEAGPDRARREGSEGDRAAVRLGSRDRRRALQQGGRHLGQDRRRSRQGHDGPAVQGEGPRPPRQGSGAGVVQLHLHDGRLRRPRFGGADPPAGRHARPDGQAGRLDHRDADHGQLPRRPERAAVLHLHPRRPQGPGRHGAEDRELGLPDAPPGRRDAGSGRHRRTIAAPATASRCARWSKAAK